MKTCIILIFLSTAALLTHAQDLVISAQAENTVDGLQYGGTIAYETSKLFSFAGFYQQDLNSKNEHDIKNTFYGAQFQLPLVKCERMAFFAMLRAGLANERFAVVVPGLETRINFGKRLGVGIGTSMRMNYPSISSRLILKMF